MVFTHGTRSMLGVCVERKPWLIAVEYAPYHDLGVVLRGCRKFGIHLTTAEMLCFATQLSDACKYLISKRLIHRDIAPRNALVCEDNNVKLADFGLTQELPEGLDVWKLPPGKNKVPVRFASPESVSGKCLFSEKSDIWAYGITLCELLRVVVPGPFAACSFARTQG